MGHAAKALKQTHNNMDIDKVWNLNSFSNEPIVEKTCFIYCQVEDLMDEVREQQQIAEEISNVISNPIAFGQDVDEDDLLKVFKRFSKLWLVENYEIWLKMICLSRNWKRWNRKS